MQNVLKLLHMAAMKEVTHDRKVKCVSGLETRLRARSSTRRASRLES